MSIINLNPKEVEVIKYSIESWREYPDLTASLDDIIKRVNFPITNLTPLQKATLIGCIQTYLIDPNKDLFKLSDYAVFCSKSDVKERMRKVDIGLNLMNKLKNKKDKKEILFEDTIEKVNQLSTITKVYFSEGNNGHIYKIGIVGENGTGINIDTDGSKIEKFTLGKIREDSFMQSASPRELITKLEYYGQEYKLTENQIRVQEILKMNSPRASFSVA